MEYATWADVNDAYELEIPPAAQPRIETLLRYASARLEALVPSLPARVGNGDVDPDLPAGLVVEAVLRVWRNPAGVTQQSTGPFNRSFNKDAGRGEIWFDPQAIAQLLAAPDSASAGVGTFRVGRPAPVVAVDGLADVGRYPYTPPPIRNL